MWRPLLIHNIRGMVSFRGRCRNKNTNPVRTGVEMWCSLIRLAKMVITPHWQIVRFPPRSALPEVEIAAVPQLKFMGKTGDPTLFTNYLSHLLVIRTTVAQTEWRKPGRCWQKEHLQHTLWWRKMWRRFLIHSIREMPTQCVPDNRCGAIFSGWLYGGHHTLANSEVSFNVCFTGGQNCCKKSIKIRVKECGSYFIYNLQN